MENLQIFNYKFVQEKSISSIEDFKQHRRLKVFYHKGTKCICCDRIGTRLIEGKDAKGNHHWDVYTDDLYPITVDHIIPISQLGHPTNLKNLQPMCAECNFKKGNGGSKIFKRNRKHGILINLSEVKNENREKFIGKLVYWRANGANSKIIKTNKAIREFIYNPKNNKTTIITENSLRINIKHAFCSLNALSTEDLKILVSGTPHELSILDGEFFIPA